jgi:hypothetical protein
LACVPDVCVAVSDVDQDVDRCGVDAERSEGPPWQLADGLPAGDLNGPRKAAATTRTITTTNTAKLARNSSTPPGASHPRRTSTPGVRSPLARHHPMFSSDNG